MKILIHSEFFDDIKLCVRHNWYPSLPKEMPRICRLLVQDGRMPGESPYHYVKSATLQGKIVHAGINLPQERVGKQKGARLIYVKESLALIKILYIGGHKDKRYNNSHVCVPLLERRYRMENFVEYAENTPFI